MVTYRFNAEDYLVPDNWDKFTPRIISYNTKFDGKTETLSHYFYVEVNWGILKKINVQVGDFITIAVGKHICRTCRQSKVIVNHHLCAECLADEDPAFLTRMQCVFGNTTSAIVQNNYICSKTKTACQYPDNWKFCSRKYTVYIARFNNLVKVGITQDKRDFNRLYEQGVQEAFIIGPLDNLPHAVFLEAELAESFGIAKELSRADKIYSFSKKYKSINSFIEIDDIKLVTDAPISYVEFQESIFMPHYKYLFHESISGVIQHIFGDIVIIKNETSTFIASLKDYEDAILQKLIINTKNYW